MAKNDQQEAYEKLLSTTLSRTIDFVKFAEAKNAALLTFSSAWMLASVNLVFGNNPIASPEWPAAFSCALPLFVISALISVFSFLPKTTLSLFHNDPERAKALLYFGDAAEFSPDTYRDRMRERYMPAEGQTATQSYLDDLSIQIVVNSKIALRKFSFFRVGALVALVGIAAFIIPSGKNLAHVVAAYLPTISIK